MDEQKINPESQIQNTEHVVEPIQPQDQHQKSPISPQASNNGHPPAERPTAQAVASSIYPEATRGIGVSNYQVPKPDTEHAEEKINNIKTKLIVILVTVLGVYTAVSALLGLFGGLTAISFGFAKTGGELTAIDVIYLIIGAGILFRRDTARLAYVFLAIIGLVLSIYGTHQVFTVTRYDNTYNKSVIANDQQQITNLQNLQNNNELNPGTHLTKTQKQQMIHQLQKVLAQNKKDQNQTYKLYTGLIQGYLLAIIPLVFLTRPKVKAVFS